MLSYRTLFSNAEFKELVKQEGNIIYFYWGNSPAGLLYTKNDIFVRVHGGEVDEKRNHGFIPELIFSNRIKYLAISDLVKDYLEKKGMSVYLNRLGTFDYGESIGVENSSIIRIVSCSNVISLKRVHLIVESLGLIKETEIEWIHFGDGPLLGEVKSLAKNRLSGNIKFDFRGRITNADLMTYYKNNYVDVFVNVSEFEGVPVSIMEALSFGIPCFATSSGATKELVDDRVGRLVNVNFDASELSNFVVNIKSFKDKRDSARKKWLETCNADVNFEELVSIFLNK